MKSVSFAPILFSVLAMLVLAGCGTTGSTGAVVVDGEPDYGSKGRAPTSPAPIESPPVSSDAPYADLVTRAGTARSKGDYDQALALLERAQRIDPNSADIYLALAETHRARGDATQARATAERGLLYCASRTQCDALRAYAR